VRRHVVRLLYFLFLVLFAGAVGAFAYFNGQGVELRFLEWRGTYSLAGVIGAAFGLGMVSGWSIVGMLRRSLRRVTEDDRR
jgi:uncharacterized membrane protein YciS (DUF1049 family)